MIMRWLPCGIGNIHIIGPCSSCYSTQGGLLIGTISVNHKGRVTTQCMDCGREIDYYIDANEEKIWKLEPVEAKGAMAAAKPA